MKTIIRHDVYGEIIFDENIWTGRKFLAIQGVEMHKVPKNGFELKNENHETLFVKLEGNFLVGAKLHVNTDVIELTPAAKWYEMVLSAMCFILIMIWGNNPVLCEIIPVVGGGIGGAVSALFLILNLMIIKKQKNILLKILISIGMWIATFFACYAIAIAIIGSFY